MIKFLNKLENLPDVSSLIHKEYKTYVPNANANLILQNESGKEVLELVQTVSNQLNIVPFNYFISKCVNDIDWHTDSRNTAININLIVDGTWTLHTETQDVSMQYGDFYIIDTSVKHKVLGSGLLMFLSITPFSREFKYDF